MDKKILWTILGTGAVAGGVALFLTATAPEDTKDTLAMAPPDIAAGRALYAENCASCHGASLQGQDGWRSPGPDGIFPAPPHDETGHTWHHGDKLLFDYVKLGGEVMLKQIGAGDARSGMPAFGDILSDKDIRDILAFIRSTWPARIQEVQAARTEAERTRGGG